MNFFSLRFLLAVLLLLAMVILLCGCPIGYYVKSSLGEIKILSRRESFDKALKDPRIDEETKRKIRLVIDVKKFAEEKLGLAHSDNYSSFVLLDDHYVVWAVTAAYKDQLKAYTWKFPFVGRVPYKGFFKKQDALDEKKDLEAQGLDVEVRGVAAFSTLGWFADPLLSSMTAFDDADLVDTIIHETTHATVYVKSNADFNERLATFVGMKGMEAYYTQKEGAGSKKISNAKLSVEDGQTFSEFMTRELKELADFYLAHKGDAHLLEAREQQFERIQNDFVRECKPRLKTQAFSYFPHLKLNNAILISYKTYYSNFTPFQKAFDKVHGDWRAFIKIFQELKSSKDPEKDLETIINKS